mmetsp:Transcript_21758/g.38449  ORF Transcript_21758/g.38449 Transcript_21758/m.38449 type:complete len:287 (-) Transcript_21758:81-941(-)
MAGMASKVQLIKLLPEEISFDMTEKEPTVQLKVQNTSEKMVAFKVKTTHPKRYLVRPNQDVIPVGGTSTVKISLQVKDAKQLRFERISGSQVLDDDCKDNKFLVQCAVVKAPLLDQIDKLYNAGNSKDLSQTLKTMWSQTTREGFVNKKLQCLFDYPQDVGKLMAVNNEENATVPFALEVNNDSQTAPRSENAGRDLVELRTKYNELINFTVQLTAERDRYKASLKESAKELQLYKKDQQRREGAVAPSDEPVKADDAVDSVAVGFSLWQIMLVAILAFLLGRLIM